MPENGLKTNLNLLKTVTRTIKGFYYIDVYNVFPLKEMFLFGEI